HAAHRPAPGRTGHVRGADGHVRGLHRRPALAVRAGPAAAARGGARGMTPDPYSFSWEPLFVVLAVGAGFLYWRAGRPERPSLWRIVVFALGLLLVVGAVASPIETLAIHYLLMMHLLQNVMIADCAPPLLVLGLTPAMREAIARAGG